MNMSFFLTITLHLVNASILASVHEIYHRCNSKWSSLIHSQWSVPLAMIGAILILNDKVISFAELFRKREVI